MAQRAAEHMEHIAGRQVQDVPALEQKFAQVEGLRSMAEDLYTSMREPAGADLASSSSIASSAIRQLRGYQQALDRARAAHRAYELYPKTYRSGGDLEMRSDFDATTRPVQEYQARDHVAGSQRLREVMGL
jgi:galactokinase/mevalonate kinase-like predicted kinase